MEKNKRTKRNECCRKIRACWEETKNIESKNNTAQEIAGKKPNGSRVSSLSLLLCSLKLQRTAGCAQKSSCILTCKSEAASVIAGLPAKSEPNKYLNWATWEKTKNPTSLSNKHDDFLITIVMRETLFMEHALETV